MKVSLAWRWFLGLMLLLTGLLLGVNVGINLSLPGYLREKIRSEIQRDAVLAHALFAPLLAETPQNVAAINALAHSLSNQTGLRMTVIAADGTVIGESDKPAEQLAQIENHLQRPEVQDALHTGLGSSVRHSDTIGVDLIYVAVPVAMGSAQAIVRVALPLHEIAQTTARVRRTVALASLVVALLALPIVFMLARRFGEPIDQMRQIASRVAAGDFSKRAPEQTDGELGELAHALNHMSDQLAKRLRELAAEKTELNATLANMIEGVLVVDAAGKIRMANAAVRRQFQLDDAALGRTVLEAFRNAPLQELIAEALGGEPIGVRELSFMGHEERIFDVNAARLQDQEGARTGVVIVFHDITRIKQLENIRKEFVANVSHELRTPLSIIKGYVETLLDEQPPDPPTSRQFLTTIDRHAKRLEALIADLLSISELESQQARLSLTTVSLATAIVAAQEELAARARDKSLTFALEIPETLPLVRADVARLHQVLFNLLDNAIKYTLPGGHVVVSAVEREGTVQVCVADNGPGIAPEHMSRIFERFYRADKARSREFGGTGLGLSIVKHIVQAHGGRVWAESELTKGSKFYFTLPSAAA